MPDTVFDLGTRVQHKFFGFGNIDQRRERSGVVEYHVNYPARNVAGWFTARDLAPVKADAAPAPAEVVQ